MPIDRVSAVQPTDEGSGGKLLVDDVSDKWFNVKSYSSTEGLHPQLV